MASPLFLIVIEILCTKLRASRKIEWFTVGNKKVLLSLYADDVSIFLPYKAINLRESIRILDSLYLLSGLQIEKKTQVCIFRQIPRGNLNFCPDIDLKWSQDFDLLGISFNGSLTNMNVNIEKKIN